MPLTGSDLTYLAAVSELARLDLDPNPVGLAALDGRITAQYAGSYAFGQRFLDYDGPDFACEVNAERFKSLAALFPDQSSVRLALDGQTLRISSRGEQSRGLSMQIQRAEIDTPAPLDVCKADTSVRINLEALRNECELAKDFTAKNYSVVLLTGINLDINERRVLISAWDSVAALLVSSLEVLKAGKNSESVNVTAPETDLNIGLKMMGSGEASLEVVLREEEEDGKLVIRPKRVRLSNSSARFSCTPIIGEWPDLSPIMRYKQYSAGVDVPGPALRDAVAGLKALSPSYAKARIEITADERRRLLIQTRQAEHGQFIICAGTAEGDDPINFSYSVNSMAIAAKLGDIVTFAIPSDRKAQTRVTSGNRRCWISATAADSE